MPILVFPCSQCLFWYCCIKTIKLDPLHPISEFILYWYTRLCISYSNNLIIWNSNIDINIKIGQFDLFSKLLLQYFQVHHHSVITVVFIFVRISISSLSSSSCCHHHCHPVFCHHHRHSWYFMYNLLSLISPNTYRYI